jgi:hypothetical protein
MNSRIARVIAQGGLRSNAIKCLAAIMGIPTSLESGDEEVYPMNIVNLSGVIVGTFECEIPIISHKHVWRLIARSVKLPEDACGYTLYTIYSDGSRDFAEPDGSARRDDTVAPIIDDALGVYNQDHCDIKAEYNKNIDLRTIREIMIVYVNYQPNCYPLPTDEYILRDVSRNCEVKKNGLYGTPKSPNTEDEEFNMYLIEALFGKEVGLIARNSLNTSDKISTNVQKILGQLYTYLPNRYGPTTIVNGKNLSDVIESVRKKICCRYSLKSNTSFRIYTVATLCSIRKQYKSRIDELLTRPGVCTVSYPYAAQITPYTRKFYD